MAPFRLYEIDGLQLVVPLRQDGKTGAWLEDYTTFIENPICTTEGRPVMFAGEDACSLAQEAAPGGCPDCGCCRFYRRAAPHTWIGVCENEMKKMNI